MEWNRIILGGIVCLDENEKSIEVDCDIDSQKFIKYLLSLSDEILLSKLKNNEKFYIPIERWENHELICSGDLEIDCEIIFIDTIKERLNKVLGNGTVEPFTYNKKQLNAFVEFNEKKSCVVIKDYQLSDHFNILLKDY